MMRVPYRTPTNIMHPRTKFIRPDLYTSEHDNRTRGIADRFLAAPKHVSLPQNARTPLAPP
jgi:hypothetical protein